MSTPEKIKATKEYLSNPENLENIAGSFISGWVISKGVGLFSKVVKGGFNVELPSGTKVGGFSLGKGKNSFLKYANEFGKCKEFVSAFKNELANTIKSLGGQIKVFEINIGKDGLIGTAENQLANNGLHQYVEVTLGNQVKIFDNFHPEGILKEDFVKNIAGHTKEGKIIQGNELIKNAKEIKK